MEKEGDAMEASGLKTRSKKGLGAEQERLADGEEEKVTGGDTAWVSWPCLRWSKIHTSINLQHSALYVPLRANCDAQQ